MYYGDEVIGDYDKGYIVGWIIFLDIDLSD